MVKNREQDNERLEEEVSESRDDMNKMIDSFRRREQELGDDLKSVQHKNSMLSDLLDLVTERAESTQKDLDWQRKESAGLRGNGRDASPGGELTSPSVVAVSPSLLVPDVKESQVGFFAYSRLRLIVVQDWELLLFKIGVYSYSYWVLCLLLFKIGVYCY